MKITDLFGDTPRDMMDYVSFLLRIDSHKLNRDYCEVKGFDDDKELDSAVIDMLAESDRFLSQSLRLEMFVRPVRPCAADPKYLDSRSNADYFKDYEIWEKWQPLFEGEWIIDDARQLFFEDKPIAYMDDHGDWCEHWLDFEIKTINDLLYHTKHIEKKYNPEFQI